MTSSFPDYYSLLNVNPKATGDEIRTAYKKESLRCHPDRLGNASIAEKDIAKEKFQAVADAYYVLSDPTRRREYDVLRATRGGSTDSDPSSSASFFANFANMFAGANAGMPTPGSGMNYDYHNNGGSASSSSESGTGSGGQRQRQRQRPDADGMFGDVFEELLRPEVERVVPFWAWLGAVCGAGLGFITANIPGLLVGVVAGNRLGAIRDAKGKSVASVFNSLGGNQKAEILKALALKVLGTATSI